MAQWLSWLERRPVTAEVESSSLFWVVDIIYLISRLFFFFFFHSSAGRASALQAEGHRFEPYRSHLYADVAQLAEQLICNQQVIGSSPIIGFSQLNMLCNGQIPEWPKGTDCKSAANCFGGSNPPPSISRKALADVAQLAEQLICNQQVIGSSPIIGFLDL